MRRGSAFIQTLVSIAAISLAASALPAHAEWKTACDKARCQLFHEILDGEKKVQARVYFHNAADDAATPAAKSEKGKSDAPKRIIGIAVVPLGIYIPAGVGVRIDDKMSFKADLVDCRIEQGCRAAFDVQPATLAALKDGKALSVTVLDRQNGRAVSFGYGLDGFGKAYEAFLAKL